MDIKNVLKSVKERNENIIREKIRWYRSRGNESQILDEKIRLALVGDIFNEIEMKLKENDL